MAAVIIAHCRIGEGLVTSAAGRFVLSEPSGPVYTSRMQRASGRVIGRVVEPHIGVVNPTTNEISDNWAIRRQ